MGRRVRISSANLETRVVALHWLSRLHLDRLGGEKVAGGLGSPGRISPSCFRTLCWDNTFFAYRLTRSLLREDGWTTVLLSVIVQVLIGTASTFVRAASIAEMYTLQWALTLLCFWMLCLGESDRRPLYPSCAGLSLGALLGNRLTTLLLLPGACLFAARTFRTPGHRRGLAIGAALAAASFTVFNLLLYYLLWRRHLSFDHWHSVILKSDTSFAASQEKESSVWRSWAFAARCGQAASHIGGASTQNFFLNLRWVFSDFVSFLGVPGAIFSLLGLARLRASSGISRCLLSTFLLQLVAVALETGTGKHDVYAFVPMMIAVFWLCLGAREALNLLPTSLAARVGIVSVIAALTVSTRLHGMWISRRAHPLQNSAPWAANVLRHLSPAATVFADWRQLYALQYDALKENPDKPLTLLEAFPDSSRGYFILPEAYREVLDLGGRPVPVYLLLPPIGPFRKYLWTDIGGGVWKQISL